MKKFYFFVLAILALVACNPDNQQQPINTDNSVGSIPSDSDADPNPDLDSTTVVLPGVTASITSEGGEIVIRLDMTGVKDPSTGEYITLHGTGDPEQNVWVEVDDQPKGISVTNISDGATEKAKADVVFLVDNSGSMYEEAEGVARDITTWAGVLASSGLDVKFGCIGYGYYVGSQFSYPTGGYGIAGGMNLADYSVLDDFLNNRYEYMWGVERTRGYFGPDSANLAMHANEDEEQWTVAGGECSVQALRFAEKYFNFRDGANRVYVNFTDDANYPGGDERWSINYIRNEWTATKGTIHTVFSNDTVDSWIPWNLVDGFVDNIKERSWEMSELTGGTITWADQSFSGITLEGLDVTEAMRNSYIIRLTNVSLDGQQHKVRITVKSADGSVAGEILVMVTFA